MNAPTRPPVRDVVGTPFRLADPRPAKIDLHEQRRKNLVQSLQRRWWYYAAVTLIAAATAFFVSKQYQATAFEAVTQVRARTLPFPPGAAQLDQPVIGDFSQFLSHPDVLSEVAGPAFRIQTFDSPKLVDKELNYETKLLTLRLKRDTPAEAADTLNALVDAAIAKSTEERQATLKASLKYLKSLVGVAEAELAKQRLAKANRLDALRKENAEQGKSSLEYSELTQQLQIRRTELLSLESELADSQRLMKILEKDEAQLVRTVIDEMVDAELLELRNSAKRFASDSGQASRFATQIAALEALQNREASSRDDLLNILHEMRQLVGPEIVIPAEHEAALARVADSRYALANRLSLLPEKIIRSRELLAETQLQRATVEIAGGLDFESLPEIEDLTSRIERAQESADTVAAAIAWTKDMERLDAPAFEQIVVADVADTRPDGDFTKLFVLTFGVVGLCLGAPVLALDIFKPPRTRVERLADDYHLPTILTWPEDGRRTQRVVGPDDPELRLLAHRLQMAADQRGSATILFSSLDPKYQSSALTGALAASLAARQANVVIVNLEGFGKPPTPPPRKRFWPIGKKIQATENSNADSKRSLAEALIDGATLPDEVRVELVSNGVDRVELGSGSLPAEAFSQPLMERLFTHLQNEYSVVLVNGPEAKHLPDVQALAAMCDGTCFLACNVGTVSPEARRTLESLVESGMPVLGIVEV